jgi:hypothetical protein
VDWSNPDLTKWPKFEKLLANEVIMSPGDFLYLPTHWVSHTLTMMHFLCRMHATVRFLNNLLHAPQFHYIISLGLNYQCNTRSGRSDEYVKDVKKCGFK